MGANGLADPAALGLAAHPVPTSHLITAHKSGVKTLRQDAPTPPGLPARGPISAQRFPTCRAERASQTNQRRKPTYDPSRSDQRSRKAAQSGLAFLLLQRPDARSPIATAVNSTGRPARAGPSAQAREVAAPRLPFAPSVLRK
ncbi:unnamed protein product [Rangifer tarandus platyrhynchus]|uniref:Uncharacterized protein n=1 Tax=Rangifer tarandus platyrhynchus TaxID=3082113 RepID=A0AC59ZRR6_RANTA